MFFIYIVQCADGSYYTGYTNDLVRRLYRHNYSKSGARYTKARRPVVLKYHEEFATKSEALRREAEIKSFTKKDKEKLWARKYIPPFKTVTLRFRAKDKKDFERVRSGEKAYETRAATKKYQNVKEGDSLLFVCDGDKFTKTIIKRFYWSSIDAMVKEISFKKVMPAVKSVKEMKKVYAGYSGYEEKIKEVGLVGFKLK